MRGAAGAGLAGIPQPECWSLARWPGTARGDVGKEWLRTWPRLVHHARHDVTALPLDVYALAAPPYGGWGLRSRAD